VQETQKSGYWIDPSTGLMWAGKDNGKDVSWKKAMSTAAICDWPGTPTGSWRTWPSLQPIYDSTAVTPGLAGPRKKPMTVTCM